MLYRPANTTHKYPFARYLFVLLLNCFLIGAVQGEEYVPREGDIIFQSLPHNDLVDAIEGATKSPYSHVGIVVKREGRWWVREALGDVHDTRFEEYIQRGRKQQYDVYRLKNKYESEVTKLIAATERYLGRPYDIRYRMDEQEIYCSELIYKAYYAATGKNMGRLVTLGSLDWAEYTQLIKTLEGGEVPKQRKMITPRDLAKADQLKQVYSNYLN